MNQGSVEGGVRDLDGQGHQAAIVLPTPSQAVPRSCII